MEEIRLYRLQFKKGKFYFGHFPIHNEGTIAKIKCESINYKDNVVFKIIEELIPSEKVYNFEIKAYRDDNKNTLIVNEDDFKTILKGLSDLI